MATQTRKAKETKLLTARELADKAGISPAVLRKSQTPSHNRIAKAIKGL